MLTLLRYSIASIYFSNGSTVNLATIEGGSAYKQVMRASDSIELHDGIAQQLTLDDHLKVAPIVAQMPLGLQSLRDYLPPWLGGHDSRTEALSRMLKALKVATESYLEAPLSDAEVIVPFPVSESYLVALRAACSSLSLRMPRSAQPPAGILAARAYGIGGKCNYDVTDEHSSKQYSGNDPEQLVLTVDYSRAALTVLLLSEQCGVFEYHRVLHEMSLGTDALFLDTPQTPGPNTGRAQLAKALYDITRLPLKTGNGAGLIVISELVVMGESADDFRLHDALVEVLLDKTSNDSPFKALSKGKPHAGGMIDPVFAASQGVAQDCWDRLNFSSQSRTL